MKSCSKKLVKVGAWYPPRKVLQEEPPLFYPEGSLLLKPHKHLIWEHQPGPLLRGVKLVRRSSHPITAWHTCDFVSDQLCGLHLPDAAEEAPQLLLRHVLRQVVHDQVGLCVFGLSPCHVVFITVWHVIHLLQERHNRSTHCTSQLAILKTRQSRLLYDQSQMSKNQNNE